ncbi:putative sugar ABC transporter, permease protein [Candidatus Vecturithrix granuli]|uniref:Putative sugar ABC transporter, permease protein n=1 Tax=Vecturithrix granuli TaxID=1499967 RepID=A0A0S6WAK3_VECG1|nr:putative sugar ABC transporter, permease protein [Candidatus Vecturithrix granuli]
MIRHTSRKSLKSSLTMPLTWGAAQVVDLVDRLLFPLQRVLGVRRMAYVFVLPNLLIFGIFILFPTLLNFYYAVTGGVKLFPRERPFVGLENFRRLFDCQNFFDPNTCREDLFARAVMNTTGYVIFWVVLLVVISMLTALALNGNIKGRGFFRSVFFFPVLLSPIVVALIWKWMLQENGLVNAVLLGVGLQKISFLTNAGWSMFWVIFISVWAQMGFYTLILLAGLQAIPGEVYEAGKIDGADHVSAFWYITLPLLMPSMLVVLVLSLIRGVQVFDVVFAFTGGGPGTATLYLVQYIYNNGFASAVKNYGLAAAASVTMGLVLIILTLIQLRLGRER